MTFEAHEFATMFPALKGEEFTVLVNDIKAHGLQCPITMFDGKILDGRNRALACEKAGVPVTTVEFTGSRSEALAFVWSENRVRRHLNSSQIAAATSLRDLLYVEFSAKVEKRKTEAKERKAKGGGDKKSKKYREEKPVTQLIEQAIPDRNDLSTNAIRAKDAGTNREYLDLTDKLAEERPDLLHDIIQGKKTIPQVKRELKKEEVTKKTATLPTDMFRVIYADPPWSYGNSGSGLDHYGPAERHYPTMSIADLCAMPIKSITEDNAVLFLWVTSPLLDECWPVIKAWGFEYKTSFVWDKVKHNFGHYNSVRHEFLLVCTRGSCTPDVNKLFDSVQTIERTDTHSEKPDEFRGIIDTIYPNGKRIELFARTKHDTWECYGNEL